MPGHVPKTEYDLKNCDIVLNHDDRSMVVDLEVERTRETQEIELNFTIKYTWYQRLFNKIKTIICGE